MGQVRCTDPWSGRTSPTPASGQPNPPISAPKPHIALHRRTPIQPPGLLETPPPFIKGTGCSTDQTRITRELP